MSTYFVGDVHGCYENLKILLDTVCFNPDIDILYLTGDLISRGPRSLDVLRWVRNLSNRAKTVLGNHELHLLQTYFKINNYKKYKSSFNSILKAPDIDDLIHWLLHQSILRIDKDKKFLISHAGIYPTWSINQSILYAKEIENILISNHPYLLLYDLNKKENKLKIHININKLKKIQNNLNIFINMRYLDIHGQLNRTYKGTPKNSPKNIYPWFNLSKFIVPNYSIIFGHWSSLQYTVMPAGFYGLDSGCCWGEYLTIFRWEDKKIIRIPCSPPS